MFDIGWSEILVIAVVAIIFVGPRELIPMLRTIGKQIGTVKKMAGEFQSQFNEALREAELDTLKKDVEKIGRLDPLREIRDKVTKDIGDVTRKLEDSGKQGAKSPATAKPAENPKLTPAPAATAQKDKPAPAAAETSDEPTEARTSTAETPT